MYSVTRIFSFEAAHFLQNYKGKCSHMHGHSYRVEVTLSGENLDEIGMLVDFNRLKILAQNHIIDRYDHKVLNDVLFDCHEGKNPTAEILAYRFFQSFKDAIFHVESEQGIRVKKVKVWETANSFAEYEE